MLDPKVVVALDFDKKNDALSFVDKISPSDCKLKVGKEMFTYFGPEFVKTLTGKGFDVFLDLKFHDIPNTVAKAVTAAADLGVWMVNVHASGGSQMMTKAKQALEIYRKVMRLSAREEKKPDIDDAFQKRLRNKIASLDSNDNLQ